MDTMRKIRATIWLAFLVLLATASIKFTHAIEHRPEPMISPVPPEWRAPFTKYLRELGVRDVGAMLNATKASRVYFNFSGDGPVMMAFRLESKETCTQEYDLCLTVVGRIESNNFLAEASFWAGNRMNHSDTTVDFFGTQSLMARFYGKETIVVVVRNAKGLVVAPGKQSNPPQ
jgi:hypothetical protein